MYYSTYKFILYILKFTQVHSILNQHRGWLFFFLVFFFSRFVTPSLTTQAEPPFLNGDVLLINLWHSTSGLLSMRMLFLSCLSSYVLLCPPPPGFLHSLQHTHKHIHTTTCSAAPNSFRTKLFRNGREENGRGRRT